ncbi:membrane lipoprotein lipid attachment site-containing protein [Bacillus sp. ISL-41]|uniref:membrane lipoprotein lipid attachment site-containing protein n=1 Tax=Bacillus sp. ISL-41 TaxID=2819127 RepID=UPI001BECD0C8|nr:membrane lipoprotein lipid attachment site-containing protein [Bacillus sp. ISL-41]MBT2644791.1 membrane lipoprotein lipid attachment site-containing protein [Bacillus sp. ISL-41]
MKKILLFILFAVILSACSKQENGVNNMKKPPELIVSSSSNKVKAVLGTYSWTYDNGDGTSTGSEADSDIPPRIVRLQTSSLNTELGSTIYLDFANPPKGVKVNIWSNSQQEREVKVEGTTFETDEKGYIVYEIYANWDQGSAHYAVKLNIQ